MDSIHALKEFMIPCLPVVVGTISDIYPLEITPHLTATHYYP
jgi:hypothetical protein